MSDNQESLLLPELLAPPTTILVSMGWAMLDYIRYNIAHTIPVFRVFIHGSLDWVLQRDRKLVRNLRHLSGALTAPEGTAPSYSQLCMYDSTVALQQRMNRNSSLRRDTMESLQTLLFVSHPYATIYKQAFEILEDLDDDVQDAEVRLRVLPGNDHRSYNLPTAEVVAVVLPGDGSPGDGRDIILRNRNPTDAPMQRISDVHPAYAPLCYVLLFPRGAHGWHPDLYLDEPEKDRPGRLTQTRYHAFWLFTRETEFSTVLRGGRLLQQYMVDAFASIDQNRLIRKSFELPYTVASKMPSPIVTTM
ncbi:hypothetical protein C8J57DRAFT_1523464 [Mycena rebaudengoi]|nr:hypothetical protein C8J57DRAFT_1523464 [Mycena rebaudengoi]